MAKAASSSRRRKSVNDAISVLKSDHAKVLGWFNDFDEAGTIARRHELAARICAELESHMAVEEQIFYPAYLEATRDEDRHHEAEVEHAAARHLIAQIRGGGPHDGHFEAKVRVLAQMIRHHIREEEGRGGMFAKARASSMDLAALGAEIRARKAEMEDDTAAKWNGTAATESAPPSWQIRLFGGAARRVDGV